MDSVVFLHLMYYSAHCNKMNTYSRVYRIYYVVFSDCLQRLLVAVSFSAVVYVNMFSLPLNRDYSNRIKFECRSNGCRSALTNF